ncbi:hypothetical protein E1286_37250 [Nonomuraea terrae]|uniref:Uncharacterized protein n=1 Tax=Nonomuraea terrae TaxID=2530383 RepID=A0A4R4Y0F0_9ACTN|nr:hypothetical protein [Nonomuraea terrae]TDD37463.1 hypothetical protein E1286_37250 [Nonomuraea terrae]
MEPTAELDPRFSDDDAVPTTGAGSLHEGLDRVVEGVAERVTDSAALKELSAAWEEKYGPTWHFEVRDGAFVNVAGGTAPVYAVRPSKVLGFRKGHYSQTRWRF